MPYSLEGFKPPAPSHDTEALKIERFTGEKKRNWALYLAKLRKEAKTVPAKAKRTWRAATITAAVMGSFIGGMDIHQANAYELDLPEDTPIGQIDQAPEANTETQRKTDEQWLLNNKANWGEPIIGHDYKLDTDGQYEARGNEQKLQINGDGSYVEFDASAMSADVLGKTVYFLIYPTAEDYQSGQAISIQADQNGRATVSQSDKSAAVLRCFPDGKLSCYTVSAVTYERDANDGKVIITQIASADTGPDYIYATPDSSAGPTNTIDPQVAPSAKNQPSSSTNEAASSTSTTQAQLTHPVNPPLDHTLEGAPQHGASSQSIDSQYSTPDQPSIYSAPNAPFNAPLDNSIDGAPGHGATGPSLADQFRARYGNTPEANSAANAVFSVTDTSDNLPPYSQDVSGPLPADNLPPYSQDAAGLLPADNLPPYSQSATGPLPSENLPPFSQDVQSDGIVDTTHINSPEASPNSLYNNLPGSSKDTTAATVQPGYSAESQGAGFQTNTDKDHDDLWKMLAGVGLATGAGAAGVGLGGYLLGRRSRQPGAAAENPAAPEAPPEQVDHQLLATLIALNLLANANRNGQPRPAEANPAADPAENNPPQPNNEQPAAAAGNAAEPAPPPANNAPQPGRPQDEAAPPTNSPNVYTRRFGTARGLTGAGGGIRIQANPEQTNRVRTGGVKNENKAGGADVKTGDTKVETGDTKIKTGDTKVKNGDNTNRNKVGNIDQKFGDTNVYVKIDRSTFDQASNDDQERRQANIKANEGVSRAVENYDQQYPGFADFYRIEHHQAMDKETAIEKVQHLLKLFLNQSDQRSGSEPADGQPPIPPPSSSGPSGSIPTPPSRPTARTSSESAVDPALTIDQLNAKHKERQARMEEELTKRRQGIIRKHNDNKPSQYIDAEPDNNSGPTRPSTNSDSRRSAETAATKGDAVQAKQSFASILNQRAQNLTNTETATNTPSASEAAAPSDQTSTEPLPTAPQESILTADSDTILNMLTKQEENDASAPPDSRARRVHPTASMTVGQRDAALRIAEQNEFPAKTDRNIKDNIRKWTRQNNSDLWQNPRFRSILNAAVNQLSKRWPDLTVDQRLTAYAALVSGKFAAEVEQKINQT